MEGKVLGWKLRIYADAFEDDVALLASRGAQLYL